MAITALVYGDFFASWANGVLGVFPLDGDTNIKVSLHTASYVPSQSADVFFSDIGSELVDPSYTPGGQALTNFTVTQTNKVVKLDADNVTFDNLSGTFRYAVIRDASTATAATEPVIAYIDFGANVVPAAQDFTILWHASGITTHTAA